MQQFTVVDKKQLTSNISQCEKMFDLNVLTLGEVCTTINSSSLVLHGVVSVINLKL